MIVTFPKTVMVFDGFIDKVAPGLTVIVLQVTSVFIVQVPESILALSNTAGT